jgi:hypothetical protein
MTDDDGAAGPLAAVGGDATRATDAFTALANETRLAILLALWEAHDPANPDAETSFSALRDRVGTHDSGRFNYHLDKLVGRYVRKTDDGYVLRRSGGELVRTVIAGAGIEEPTLERTEIDVPCPYCGAPTAISYEDEWLYQVCTACEGSFEGSEEQPEGYLTGVALDPAGFLDRDPEALWAAALSRGYQEIKTTLEGVCDECSGVVERTLDVCPDHDDEGVCSTCNRRPVAIVYLGCTVCGNYHAVSPGTLVIHHPAVVAFYYDHGIETQYVNDTVGRMRDLSRLLAGHELAVLGVDPPRVQVRIDHEGERLQLTLDETAAVVEVAGPD